MYVNLFRMRVEKKEQFFFGFKESIRDLLSRDQNKRLQLQEHPKEGVYVHDLSSFITKNMQEIEHVMTTGNLNRSTG